LKAHPHPIKQAFKGGVELMRHSSKSLKKASRDLRNGKSSGGKKLADHRWANHRCYPVL